MNKRNKKQQGKESRKQHIVKMFVERIEPYWKIVTAMALIAATAFKVGVWVGERNKLDEIIKERSEHTEKVTELIIELTKQDRKPIVINLNDSIENGKQKK